jgi:hypothetical protein
VQLLSALWVLKNVVVMLQFQKATEAVFSNKASFSGLKGHDIFSSFDAEKN